MNNTERKIYFSVYCLTFTFYGCFLSALGPIIPFLAKEYNQPETSFTYLFTCRTVGMLIGAMLSRWLTDKLTYHCIILTAVLGSVMPFLIFPAVDWLMLRAVCLLVTAIFCAIFQVVLTLCILKTHQNHHEDFWLQVMHSMFGVGGFIGPIFVHFWGINGMIFIAFGMLISFPGYVVLKTPQYINSLTVTPEGDKKHEQRISGRVLMIICGMMFLFFGEETSFAGWIATYAVVRQFADEHTAPFLPSIFWSFMTIGGFVVAALPGKPSEKLNVLILAKIVTFAVCLLLDSQGLYSWSGYISSVCIGTCYSTIHAYNYTISLEYDQHITSQDAVTMMIFSSLGDGVVCLVVGWLMHVGGVQMLYVVLALVAGLMYGGLKVVLRMLAEDREEIKKPMLQG